MELINESGLAFTNISSEEWREYLFPRGEIIRIQRPQALNVSKAGGHRLLDGEGISHYIPSGWIKLSWKATNGLPHFVK